MSFIYILLLMRTAAWVEAGGELSFRLRDYAHLTDLGDNGNRCDGVDNEDAASECDPYFKVCLGRSTGRCNILSKTTKKYRDTRHVFWDLENEKIGINFKNPTNLSLNELPSKLHITIDVRDHDSQFFNSDDDMATLERVVDFAAMKSGVPKVVLLHDEQHGMRMNVTVTKTCSINFYGPLCQKQCIPRPNYSSCDENGIKTCLESSILVDGVCVTSFKASTSNRRVEPTAKVPDTATGNQSLVNGTDTGSSIKRAQHNIYIFIIPGVCGAIILGAIIATIVIHKSKNTRPEPKTGMPVAYIDDRARLQLLRDDLSSTGSTMDTVLVYEKARGISGSLHRQMQPPNYNNQVYLATQIPSNHPGSPTPLLNEAESEYAEIPADEDRPPDLPPPREGNYTALRSNSGFNVMRKFSKQNSQQ